VRRGFGADVIAVASGTKFLFAPPIARAGPVLRSATPLLLARRRYLRRRGLLVFRGLVGSATGRKLRSAQARDAAPS
jgi:hypothetical protein